MSSSDYVRKQKKFYDRKAPEFDKGFLFPRKNRNHLLKIQKIAAALRLSRGDNILEVGAGTGIHGEYLLKYTDILYIGIDISKNMLKKAEERLTIVAPPTRYKLIRAEAEKLPFPEGYFDAVFCSGTLHHTFSPQAVIQEMVRVLKPKKRIVIMEPNYLFPTNFISAVASDLERNILLMRKNKLRIWAAQLPLAEIIVENFLYTPPIPVFLCSFYDLLDKTFKRVPILRNFSIMLMLSAKKIAS